MNGLKRLKWFIKLIVLLVIGLGVFVKFKTVFASESGFLTTTVKISICGNDVVEGGEDCEGNNLHGRGCNDLGYRSGSLSCDVACTYDLQNCVDLITPTPTPTVTPSVTASPTSSSSNTSSNTNNESSTNGLTAILEVRSLPKVVEEIINKVVLPAALKIIDPNGNGIIELRETFAITKSWVEEWRNYVLLSAEFENTDSATLKSRKCDINNDRVCDIRDFSILMSYIER